MEKMDKCKDLEKMVLERGYPEAKVISADKVVVEDRVRLKCMVGCPYYGQGLRCPPYTPSIDEFRRMLNDYKFAMVVKIKPQKIPDDVMAKYKLGNNEIERVKLRDQYKDADKTSSSVWSDFAGYYKESLMDLLDLESAAFSLGYTFATVFFAGRCMLCEKCNVKEGICRNPVISRFSAEAMGINLLKTAKNAGMNLEFGPDSTPTPMAILLVD
jgi:predicted metal-binding protein